MAESKLRTSIRKVSPFANAIDMVGEISGTTEKVISEAYAQATAGRIMIVLLNFTQVAYMNSFGIGILTMLIIRAQREGKRIVGYGLNEHYHRIFELTRLDQVIPIYESEEVALAYVAPYDLPERES